MATINLTATKRTVVGKQVGALRRAGRLPAVLYGPGSTPMSIELDAHQSMRALQGASSARLIQLNVDGMQKLALIREIQRDSIRRHFLHIDFYEVAMDRAIRVELPVELVGTSPAVRDLNGVLVHGLTSVEIECLPGDLVDELQLDIGRLETIGAALHVRDLIVPDTIKVLTDPDGMMALVTHQQAEEVVAPVEAAVSVEPEVIEKGKKEEAAEGEGEEE